MKSGKFLSLVLAVIILSLAAGCSRTPSADTSSPSPQPTLNQTSAPEGITVTDMLGRVITLDKPAEKVVALTAADCEILYAIGSGDAIVGRGEYCDYPIEVLAVPAVQSGAATNVEQIISLAPQIVIMAKMAQTVEQVASLEAAGIKVVISDADDIAGTYTAIELIGELVGKSDEAAALIEDMRSEFDLIKSKATGDGGKTVYFEVSPLEFGLWTAGSGTFMDELAGLLGLTNIFEDITGWAEVSEEQVIARNPDYIVTITMFYGDGPTPEEEIMSRAGWQSVTAVAEKKVLNVDSYEIARPGPRLVNAAETLYSFIYGD
ncbi:MAG: ABC transporter substrate-binding protein [Clostridiales bacterium]|nr:ABC transporter substrate-binding protein [Clostridiales bacterium]